MVADMKVDKLADMEVDMVADMIYIIIFVYLSTHIFSKIEFFWSVQNVNLVGSCILQTRKTRFLPPVYQVNSLLYHLEIQYSILW